MAKYIDADTVVSMPFLDDSYSIEKHTVETDTIENLLDRFTNEGCPELADVVEVKHGEWMSVPDTWGVFDIRYYCSECGKDAIINNNERYVLSDYCPHCFAKMDGKKRK